MSFQTGRNIRVTVFGQSHSRAIGAVIDGLPAGEKIDLDEVSAQMQRRAPGQDDFSTARREADVPEILSGLENGVTCGGPLAMMITNADARSGDYDKLKPVPRPSHADYPARVKYGNAHDGRGGGFFSGRMTAPLCFAGAVCRQILQRRGVTIGAHIAAIGNVEDTRFDPVEITRGDLDALNTQRFAVVDKQKGEAMRQLIAQVKKEGDSIGGMIECAAVGLPAGIGSPIYDGVENEIAKIIFGIPAIRGIEFGTGFAAAGMRASAHNDAYVLKDGRVQTETNHAGGVLGGLTTGMPLVFRVAVKPTPSIAMAQETLNLDTQQIEKLQIGGRHDPCIVPRAVVCVESAAAVAILDLMMEEK